MAHICVGREFEISKLEKFFHKSILGDFQICFIVGEAGSGKTTLVNKFIEIVEADVSETIVVIGECNSFSGVSNPYLPFRDILSMLTGDFDSKISQGRVSRQTSNNIKKFLATSIETVLEMGPDLIGSILPAGTLIMRGLKVFSDKSEVIKKIKSKLDNSGSLELSESTIFYQYANVLSKLSQKTPLLIVLDDLHWADTASVSLLFHLSRKLKSSRIMIIGTYRHTDIFNIPNDTRHPLATLINETKRYYGDIFIDLSNQSEADGYKFVNSIIDIEPNLLNIEFRKKLFSLTEGNALFVTELLQNLKENGGLLSNSEMKWIEGSTLNWNEIPVKVEGVIEERISRLEKQLREELSIASVEGENFTAQVIGRLKSLSERTILNDLTTELNIKHRLVVESGELKIGSDFLSFFRFGHSLIQQYLYNGLGKSERRILHKDVAETLEFLYQDQVNSISSQLARHYEEAGDIEKATSYLLKAAATALTISAFTDAKLHLERAMQLGVTNISSLIKLHQYLGNVYFGLSNYVSANKEFITARDLAISISDKLSQAQIENDLGHSMLEIDIPRSNVKKLFESSLQLAREIDNLDIQIRSLTGLGAILSYDGNMYSAQKLFEESLDLANKNHKKIFILTFYHLGFCYRIMENFSAAKQVLVRGIELSKEGGNLENEGYCWNELGYVQYDVKEYGEAERSFKIALSIGKEINTQWTIAESLNGLGFIACDLNDLTSAHKFFKKALSIYYSLNIYTGFLLSLIGFANLLFRQEKFSDALELIGLATSQMASASDVKKYVHTVLELFETHKFPKDDINYYIKVGAEKNLDDVIHSLLK